MRVESIKSRRIVVVIAVLALLVAACTGGAPPPRRRRHRRRTGRRVGAPSAAAGGRGGPVAVCELAYYTGEFASYGPSLTNDVRFPIEEVINPDPPLGRTWELVSEDIGDGYEGQAAKTCLEQHGAEILVSIAHQYRTYRDYMMESWQENDSPLGPSVHGGAIPGNLGGKAAEPIFRAQGLDQALGTYGEPVRERAGPKNIVIFATQVEGFQLAADAAEQAAEAPGPQRRWRASTPRPAALLPGGGPEDRRPEPGRRHRPGGLDRVRRAHQGGGRGRPVAQLDRRDRLERGRVHRDAGHRADRDAEVHRLPHVRAEQVDPGLGLLPAAVGRPDRQGLRRHQPVRLLDLRPDGPDGPRRRGRGLVQGE